MYHNLGKPDSAGHAASDHDLLRVVCKSFHVGEFVISTQVPLLRNEHSMKRGLANPSAGMASLAVNCFIP